MSKFGCDLTGLYIKQLTLSLFKEWIPHPYGQDNGISLHISSWCAFRKEYMLQKLTNILLHFNYSSFGLIPTGFKYFQNKLKTNKYTHNT